MDFLKFFGLKEDPFRLTPDPIYFYPSKSHKDGLLLMDYSVDQKEGFVLITGEPGTGKTTLLRVFLQKWKDKAEIAMILTPRLTPEAFLASVAEDLGIKYKRKNKNEIIRSLRDFLAQKAEEGKRVIIIVDEAQNLPPETLEELRLLSNLETDTDKLLQIILLGQPEIEEKLKRKELRQLDQRITTRIRLKRLSRDETLDYINFRLIKAGRENLQISKKAVNLIYRITNGIPRLINMLISRALMAAYLEESSTLLPQHVRHAVKSLGHTDMKVKRWVNLIPTPATIAFGVIIITLLIILSLRVPDGIERVAVAKEKSAPAYKIVAVDVDVAVVRNAPSINATKAGWLLRDNQLVVLDETVDENNTKWYQIPYMGERKWISEQVVRVVDLK